MRSSLGIKTITFLVFVLLVSACGKPESNLITTKVTQVVKIYLTATHAPTATTTPTVNPSPTPTATALPMSISGDPRQPLLNEPVSQNGAPCGLVDTLDYPLNPPDGDGTTGGGDFGTYRRRYEKYHTGEDWGFGSSNFGSPVYSIGHGRVTYAQPLGWGVDQGVIIVEHTFREGRILYSFYGHLDPPSVLLKVGECVSRGDLVGEIGRPRTRPHLHFEIRSHLPDTPGPGYWPVDPTRAGWWPPSETIANFRIENAPGVEWMRPNTTWSTGALGLLANETFIAIENQNLVGVDLKVGDLQWSYMITDTVRSALLDENQTLIYLSNSRSTVSAYPVTDLSEHSSPVTSGSLPEPVWLVSLEGLGGGKLIPLPGGGVVSAARNQLTALSENGTILWEVKPFASVVDWNIANHALIVTTSDEKKPLWSLTESGAEAWEVSVGGKPVTFGEQTYLYSESGIYRLNAASHSVELVYPLSKGILRWGDIAPLTPDNLLVIHHDSDDVRLLALGTDGTLNWERSLVQLPSGQTQLLVHQDQVYLLLQHSTSAASHVSIYSIDMDQAELVLIFTGSTRTPITIPGITWAVPSINDFILFNIGGGGMVAFKPEQALQRVLGTADTP